MFSFARDRAPRRPSLTPMIDVVFLLLIFFMLTAQFTRDHSLSLRSGGGGASAYTGPPRLVRIAPDDLRLNGQTITLDALAGALAELTRAPSDMIVLRPAAAADLQRLVQVMTALEAAGFTRLSLVEE
ncbi:biopolymer transporter ExbD [Salibaculum sp.]|uniref:ExbD/TolR family protein n=1 Tax=Salibaculum sp. TaxID=2855480 RepID=UPI002B48BE8D|nr:biopolymer transporter ExbD [Salibaculum sp.]HKL69342.1 biopolymer transporter ExbD [Salibaculum sp.]